jgi:hypothetical protein
MRERETMTGAHKSTRQTRGYQCQKGPAGHRRRWMVSLDHAISTRGRMGHLDLWGLMMLGALQGVNRCCALALDCTACAWSVRWSIPSMYGKCSRYRHSHGTKQVTNREGYLMTSWMPTAFMIRAFSAIFRWRKSS